MVQPAATPTTDNHLSDFWENVPCNLCGSNDYRVKYEGTTDADMEQLLRSYSASGNFISKEQLVQCTQCGLIFTSPRLRKDLILKGYIETPDPLYLSQANGRMKSFKRCLDAVMKYKETGSILDVGSAAGFFLKVAKDSGWDTFGVEPSKYLSEHAQKTYGLKVYQGTLETAPSFGRKMDVITLWDVLEHTLDPKNVLLLCNRFLNDGGIIVINYPNISNWMARLAGRRYWFILSVHLYYFVPKTIRKFLHNTGFEILEEAPHFQWLELGYLIYRLEAYLPQVAKWIGVLFRRLNCDRMLIPYFAAQTRVIAKKVATA